jgi:hypothetical protein
MNAQFAADSRRAQSLTDIERRVYEWQMWPSPSNADGGTALVRGIEPFTVPDRAAALLASAGERIKGLLLTDEQDIHSSNLCGKEF